MTVAVAGSRTITAAEPVMQAIDESGFVFTRVISGCAGGVDASALMKPWACEVVKMPAEWRKYGRRAGFLRNAAMEKEAEALVAVWDGQSRGTWHTISLFQAAGKPYVVVWAKGQGGCLPPERSAGSEA